MLSRREGHRVTQRNSWLSAGSSDSITGVGPWINRSQYSRRQQVPSQGLFQLDALTDLEENMVTVGWRLRSAPWPQWSTCSITRIHPASPAPINLLKTGEKKERTHALSPPPLSLSWRGGSTMRVTNCSYYGGSTFQVPITLPDFKRWVLLLPPVSFCLSEWHEAPGMEDFSRKKQEEEEK